MSGDNNDNSGSIRLHRSWLKDLIYILAAAAGIYIALRERITKVEARQDVIQQISDEREKQLDARLERIERQLDWIAGRMATPSERRAR